MDNKNIDYLVLLILNFLFFVLGRVFAFWFGCKYCDCCKPFRHAYMEIELLWFFCKAILIVEEKKKKKILVQVSSLRSCTLKVHDSYFHPYKWWESAGFRKQKVRYPLQYSCSTIFYYGLRSHVILKSIA